MKLFPLIIVFAFLASCSPEVKENPAVTPVQDTLANETVSLASAEPLDSLSVRNELVNAPFHPKDEMLYFRKIMPKLTERQVELKPNIHDATTIDTITTLHWGKSYIETISNTAINRTLVNYAIINDNNIVLKNDVRIGQDLKTVCEALHIKYDSTKRYKLIELITPDEEAESYLTLYFKDNILASIIYSPYTG